jgi:PilZ domain
MPQGGEDKVVATGRAFPSRGPGDPGEPTYLVLADRAEPYLLARVRWPDVAQAISASSPDWLDDPGLFDLPYDPSAVTVSFPQAASVAASWGRQLHPGTAQGVLSYIRRMPANWSDLSPSERRTWGIEFVGTRRVSTRRVGHRRWFGANNALSPGAQRDEQTAALAEAGAGGPVANGRSQLAGANSSAGSVAVERRRQARVGVGGRAHIRAGHTTLSAGLVDLSERGVRCALPEAPPLVVPGAALGGPFLLETELMTARICLDTAGRISWHRSIGAGIQFGVAFAELAEGDAQGLQRLLATARKSGGHR